MFDSRSWRIALAVAALAVVGGGALLAWRVAGSPAAAESVAAEALRARGQSAPAPAQDAATAARARPLVVFVSGAVSHPGMYQLVRGSRIADAVAAAGGLLPDADPNRLPNLAGRLTDGKQVKVARRGGTTTAAAKLDINTATLEELIAVPGVDPGLAQAIVDERDGYGPFTSLTELHTVLGLDTLTVSALRPYLKVLVP